MVRARAALPRMPFSRLHTMICTHTYTKCIQVTAHGPGGGGPLAKLFELLYGDVNSVDRAAALRKETRLPENLETPRQGLAVALLTSASARY